MIDANDKTTTEEVCSPRVVADRWPRAGCVNTTFDKFASVEARWPRALLRFLGSAKSHKDAK